MRWRKSRRGRSPAATAAVGFYYNASSLVRPGSSSRSDHSLVDGAACHVPYDFLCVPRVPTGSFLRRLRRRCLERGPLAVFLRASVFHVAFRGPVRFPRYCFVNAIYHACPERCCGGATRVPTSSLDRYVSGRALYRSSILTFFFLLVPGVRAVLDHCQRKRKHERVDEYVGTRRC